MRVFEITNGMLWIPHNRAADGAQSWRSADQNARSPVTQCKALPIPRIPKSGRAGSLAICHDSDSIGLFCTVIYEQYVRRFDLATDEMIWPVYRADLDRMKKAFILFDPDFMDWPNYEYESQPI